MLSLVSLGNWTKLKEPLSIVSRGAASWQVMSSSDSKSMASGVKGFVVGGGTAGAVVRVLCCSVARMSSISSVMGMLSIPWERQCMMCFPGVLGGSGSFPEPSTNG